MGVFKQMKDMRDMVNAAPAMVAQAQQLGAQAQQMAAAQQAAMQAQYAQHSAMAQPGAVAAGPDLDPIAGVTLDQFAAVSKGVAVFNYDQSKLVEVAASHGIPAVTWEEASNGWNQRIRNNPAVAQRFNQLYRAS